MTHLADKIAEVNKIHPFGLAQRAGSHDPDSAESPGARWLADVRDSVTEAWEGGQPDEQVTEELWTESAPVYTDEAWKVATDLGAWRIADDIEDLRGGGLAERDGEDGLTHAMKTACRIFAKNLAEALAEELREAHDADA